MTREEIRENVINAKILKGHNIEPYINVTKMFETEDRVCIEHATGTGKSFIALQLMYDNKDKKIIYLVPRNGIGDQIEEHILGLSEEARKKYFPNVEIRTYQSLLNMTEEELKKLEIDYLITDEYHHITSPEWGKRINTLIDSNEKMKIFGMTATSTRGLGTANEENVSETFFKGNVASRLTLAEAIARSILKAPKYVSVNYDFHDDINKVKEKLSKRDENSEINQEKLNELNRLEEKARKIVKEAPSFEEIIKNNLKPNGKYIVFCPLGRLDETMNEAKNGWLKNIADEQNINMYYSTSSEIKKSRENQKAFYEDNDDSKLRIMFAMDMYNEGIHVPDIDGVIMLRPTKSDIIFYQQLGRALACHSDSKQPLVLDFVNNIYAINKLSIEIKKVIREIKEKNNTTNDDEEYFDDFNFNINEEELELLEYLKSFEESLTLSTDEKIAEFIEIINNSDNKIFGLTSKEIQEKEFSNGGKVRRFWTDNKDKIKDRLLNSMYEKGYDNAKKKIWPKEIDKVAEFIEIINNPDNKAFGLTSEQIQEKEFSNGDKVGQFWSRHSTETKDRLQNDPRYNEGYEQVKEKIWLKEIDKVAEYIDIINDEDNKSFGLKSKKIQEKEFSNGDKVRQFWQDNREKIKDRLLNDSRYEKGYEQAKKKVWPKEIDKVAEFIEIINNPDYNGFSLLSNQIQEKKFSNGGKVGRFWKDNKDKIKDRLLNDSRYEKGYDNAKEKIWPKEIDKVAEFIEIINNPDNKAFGLTSEQIQEKEFSNGDKVGTFWSNNKDKIKYKLQNDPQYKEDYKQIEEKIWPKEIDKEGEFIEIINNPDNKAFGLTSEQIQEKEFSNGDKVGYFWSYNKDKIKDRLLNPMYEKGYDNAKEKIWQKEIDKVAEFIEIINNPDNKGFGLLSNQIQEKEFSNGDKVGYFWSHNKDKVKDKLLNPMYEKGYDNSKEKIWPREIDKVSEFIEIINNPDNKSFGLKSNQIQEKKFSNGDKVGYFWNDYNKDKIKDKLLNDPQYKEGYDQVKNKVGLLNIETNVISEDNNVPNTYVDSDTELNKDNQLGGN